MLWQGGLAQDAGADRVIDVVVDIGNDVGHARDLAFDRGRAMFRRRADRHAVLALRVPGNAVANLPRQVQALTVVLQHVDNAQALLVVVEATRHQFAHHPFAGVAERRVAEVVPERNRFGKLLMQPQHLGNGPRNLRHFERVRQSRAVMVAGRREKHLRLVLQPPERLGVDDAIPIALEGGPDRIFFLAADAALAIGTLRRLRRENLALALLELLPYRGRHDRPIISLRKLVPFGSGPTPKFSASVCPRSANVCRRPRSTPAFTPGPYSNTGTCSRE